MPLPAPQLVLEPGGLAAYDVAPPLDGPGLVDPLLRLELGVDADGEGLVTLRRGGDLHDASNGRPVRVTNVASPRDATDAVPRAYLDAWTQRQPVRDACVAAWHAPLVPTIGEALRPGSVLDGVPLRPGDRVLLFGQASHPVENGIWVVPPEGTVEPPRRPQDLGDGARADGVQVAVSRGGSWGDRLFWCVSDDAIVGRDPLVWHPFGERPVRPGIGLRRADPDEATPFVLEVDPATVPLLVDDAPAVFERRIIVAATNEARPGDTSAGALVVAGGASVAGDLFTRSTFTLSDARCKRNVRPLGPSALDAVRALRGCRFRWRADGRRGVGLLAQDVRAVAPLCVVRDPITDLHAVDYTRLVPYLVESVKVLATRCEALESALSSLGGRRPARAKRKRGP